MVDGVVVAGTDDAEVVSDELPVGVAEDVVFASDFGELLVQAASIDASATAPTAQTAEDRIRPRGSRGHMRQR